MADIKLTRPAAGQNVVVPSAPDARMVLDFAADQVSIDRPQGSDSLYFRFDDGSSIELQNFYTQYNKDAIPSFEVDGQLIAGADFFNAFGPDLAPAAGPAAGPTRSGRYSDFGNSNLADGADYSVSDGHTSASDAVSVGVSVDNWDGHGGHLLFSAPDANGHYTAQAASGHNVILGGDNDDILYGGTGDDILYGGAGHNELHGGDGNDHLYGGTSYGGTSNDFLDGGKGSNVLDGGAGNDVLVFHQGDHIDGGANTDMLLVSGTDTTSVDDLFNSKTSNIEVIVKGSAVDSLTDMKALADKGISFNEHNQVELDAGKGWQDTHTSVDGHDVWTNTAGDLTVTIKHDDAENAKNVIVATHNS